MKKEITITLEKPFSGIDGVTHVKSVILIGTSPTFEPDTLVIDHELLQDGTGLIDILTDRVILDFPRTNTVYFCRTETWLGGSYVDANGDTQVYDEAVISPISKITRTGTSSTYQYSNTIIKTPFVRITTANRDNLVGYQFECDEMKVYRGKGTHTSTTWRLLDDNRIIWERKEVPDSKTAITIPLELKGNHSYTLECAHHSGDSMSEFGKHYFETDINQEQTFNLLFDKDLYGRNIVSVNSNNFIELQTRFTDYMTHTWKVLQDGVAVLRDSTNVRESELDVFTSNINISGYDLTEGTYTILIDAIFSGTKMRRIYEFEVVENDVFVYDHVDKELTQVIFNHDPVITSGDNLTVIDSTGGDAIDGKYSFAVVNGFVERYVRTGSSYQARTMQDKPAIESLEGYETRIDILWDRMIVQTIKEVVIASVVEVRRFAYVYHYDKVNHCIYNMSDFKEIDMGPIVELRNSLTIVPAGHHEIKAVVLTPALDLQLTTYSIRQFTASIIAPISLGGDYGAMTIPHIVSMDKRYNLIVGDGLIQLMHKTTNIFLAALPLIDGVLDFTLWTSLISSANGDVLLIGLDTRVSGAETLCYFKWSEDEMGFRLMRTFNVPSSFDANLGSITNDLYKPHVLKTSNGYIGLGYNETTLWLS